MTNIYLRVVRNRHWKAVEIEHLTPEERRDLLKARDPEELMRFIDRLCEVAAKAEPVVEFGSSVLTILQMEKQWSADTFELISDQAIELGLAETDKEGSFRRK